MDSFLQATPPSPSGQVEDEVDTYAALGLARETSEFSTEKKRLCMRLSAFCMVFYTKGR